MILNRNLRSCPGRTGVSSLWEPCLRLCCQPGLGLGPGPPEMALRPSKGNGSAGHWDSGAGKADFNVKRKKKVVEIHQALNSDPVEVAALRRMAISEGGLLIDEIRYQVWPKLLNISCREPPTVSRKDLRVMSKDYQQVLLDTRRSLRLFPLPVSDEQREGLQGRANPYHPPHLESQPSAPLLPGLPGHHGHFSAGDGREAGNIPGRKIVYLRDFMDPTPTTS